ncbi:(4Fe-4S)-binding protein [Changchengzhania lutea]|uniref:(4Fe-4S)-binding protein n=1 Tax=Changchengzhania lutea TaxID=2049305 RepID=UPI00115EBB7B|nr:(4Fe-4S)-binding protein [Changchengzhania lutea]
MGKTKEFSNGEITVVWKPESCIHSANCVNGLPKVFQPGERPWIKIDNATTEALISQVKECPSGALSSYKNGDTEKTSETSEIKVQVLGNGPLLVSGTLEVTLKDGATETKTKSTAFCRCGASHTKPYCDGSHVKENFKG